MTRKTRKEKLQSIERKKKLYLFPKETSQTKVSPHTIQNHSLSDADLAVKKHFIVDFTRSFVVIVCIFTLEIILYFASMSNYISKVLGY